MISLVEGFLKKGKPLNQNQNRIFEKKKLCFEKRILEDQNFLMSYNFGNIIALKRKFWKRDIHNVNTHF